MASVLRLRDPKTGNWVEVPALKGTSAYESAQEGGYTGTEEQFSEALAYLPGYIENLIPVTHKRGTIVSEKSVGSLGINVISHIEPVQAGSGDPSPSNVRPISGWEEVLLRRTGKNLLPAEEVVSFTTRKRYDLDTPLPPGTYTVSGMITSSDTDQTTSRVGFQGGGVDGSIVYATLQRNLRDAATVTVYNPVTTIFINAATTSSNSTGDTATAQQMQVECGTVATDYEPYQGRTLIAELPETVYGGMLNWTTGVLTVTHISRVLDGVNNKFAGVYTANGLRYAVYLLPYYGDKTNNNTSLLTSHLKTVQRVEYGCAYIAGVDGQQLLAYIQGFADVAEANAWLVEQAEAGTPFKICYKLATPYTIPLIPQPILSISGENTLWSTCSETEAVFNLTPVLFSRTNSGGFYHVVGGQVEWVNPPMIPGEEYRTIERYRDKPVWRKLVIGSISIDANSSSNPTLAHGISNFDTLLGCSGLVSGSLLPIVKNDLTVHVMTATDSHVTFYADSSSSTSSSVDVMIDLKYTKLE